MGKLDYIDMVMGYEIWLRSHKGIKESYFEYNIPISIMNKEQQLAWELSDEINNVTVYCCEKCQCETVQYNCFPFVLITQVGCRCMDTWNVNNNDYWLSK